MRVTRFRVGYVPLFLVLHATLADSALAAAKGFVVQQARVFDGERAHPNMTVVVRDGVIQSVQSETIVPPGFEVIDGSGRTLLPGLFDSHAHMRNDALTQALAFGVTTVLDMFADPEWAAERRTEQQRGRVTSRADLFSAGLLVTAPGAHGTQYEIKVPTITSPGEAREAVEFRIAQGSDYIKIIYEPERNSIDATTMRAVIEEAHRHERMAVVHVVTLEHARTAIAAGADGIVHLFAERVADSDFLELISRRAVGPQLDRCKRSGGIHALIG